MQTSAGSITPGSTTGTTAQLLLPDTTPGTVTSVTISVAAQNGCGGPVPSSAVSTLTLPVTPAPAKPTNMQLSNGLCPTTAATDKTVTVTKVGNPDFLEWRISGTGAYFPNTNSQTYRQPVNGSTPPLGSATIKTPQPGAITVTCQQRTVCGGYGTALSATYQIGDIAPVCPTPTVTRSPCTGTPTILFDPTNAGLNYYPNGQPYNVSSGAILTITQSSSGSNTATISGSGNGPFTFDQDVFVTSPCAGSGTGFISCSGTTTLHLGVRKFVFQGQYCRGVAETQQAPVPAEKALVFLYPNPTSGKVEIQTSQPARYQWVKVVSMADRVLYEQRAATEAGVSSFDVQALPTGLYEVQLFDGSKLLTQRLIKE